MRFEIGSRIALERWNRVLVTKKFGLGQCVYPEDAFLVPTAARAGGRQRDSTAVGRGLRALNNAGDTNYFSRKDCEVRVWSTVHNQGAPSLTSDGQLRCLSGCVQNEQGTRASQPKTVLLMY